MPTSRPLRTLPAAFLLPLVSLRDRRLAGQDDDLAARLFDLLLARCC